MSKKSSKEVKEPYDSMSDPEVDHDGKAEEETTNIKVNLHWFLMYMFCQLQIFLLYWNIYLQTEKGYYQESNFVAPGHQR